MRSKSIVIGLCMLGCFVIGAAIYAQVSSNSNNNRSVPQAEINARFASADKNGDGVLCKEEFTNYFAQTKQVKTTAVNAKKSACCGDTLSDPFATTSQSAKESGCCGGKDKAKTVDAKSGEKDCCGEGKKAETVGVKFSKEGEAKESGCCGGKDKTKTVDAKSGEKSCCSEGKKAETVGVKFSKEGEAKESGCCGGKDKAKTVDAKSGEVKKETNPTNPNETSAKADSKN
ncbi:MAG: hypothetical protein LBT09_16260 [Planctomycetaceae bacterium]|jgi:hypothetical protein|nr:hypothetical protein [Planctomycetaceae bacterium]